VQLPEVADFAMKWHIVANGPRRVRNSAELQAQLRQLRESIHARYAAQLAEARFFKRFVLRWRMAREYRRERRRIEPSLHSLYLGHIATGEMKGNKPSQPSSC